MESLGAGRQEKYFCTHTALDRQTHVGGAFKMQLQSFTLKVPSFRMKVPGFSIEPLGLVELLGLIIAIPIFVVEMPAPHPNLEVLSA